MTLMIRRARPRLIIRRAAAAAKPAPFATFEGQKVVVHFRPLHNDLAERLVWMPPGHLVACGTGPGPVYSTNVIESTTCWECRQVYQAGRRRNPQE